MQFKQFHYNPSYKPIINIFLNVQSMLNVTYIRLTVLLLYCAPMWCDCAKTALRKIENSQQHSLRRFMACHGTTVLVKYLPT